MPLSKNAMIMIAAGVVVGYLYWQNQKKKQKAGFKMAYVSTVDPPSVTPQPGVDGGLFRGGIDMLDNDDTQQVPTQELGANMRDDPREGIMSGQLGYGDAPNFVPAMVQMRSRYWDAVSDTFAIGRGVGAQTINSVHKFTDVGTFDVFGSMLTGTEYDVDAAENRTQKTLALYGQ